MAQALQTRTMLSWPDGSPKWVLVDSQADLSGNSDHRLRLTWSGDDPRPDPKQPVLVRETVDGTCFIETGQRRIAIAPSGALPFARAYVGDDEVIPDEGLQASMRVEGALYELRAGGRVEIEEPGPLRVVVRVDGLALGADGTPGFDVTDVRELPR